MSIYGIQLYWQESVNTPYLMAVSRSQDILEQMIVENHLREETDCVVKIEPIYMYVVSKGKEGIILLKKTDEPTEPEEINKLYAMNREFHYPVIHQVLLKISHEAEESSVEYQEFCKELRNNPMFTENDFSTNPIELDRYYEEGILNA